MNKYLLKILKLFLFLLIVHCTLNIEHCEAQWIQQNVPFTSGIFLDMKFINANTGFISNSTPLLIKTTNAGFNWQILNDYDITSISTVDSMYIYGAGHRAGYSKLYKSTNCGVTWDSLLYTGASYGKIHFFNRDTGIISGSDGSWSYIWRTTNGGLTKELLTTINWSTYGYLFFLKEKVNGEYFGLIFNGPGWYKTTNSGLSWQAMPNIPTFYQIKDIFFLNQNTGWATIGTYATYVYYTINGGYNWTNQTVPISSICQDIYFANQRIGWIGCGNNIFATSNGGLNWGIQTIPGGVSSKLFFLDSLTGWTTAYLYTLAHTTNGGGPINKITNNPPWRTNEYQLFQNYPNPFNSMTNVKVQMLKPGFVEIKVFDLTGKLIKVLIKQNFNSGEHNFKINLSDFTSGVYFYSLFLDDKQMNTKKFVLLK